MARDTLPDGSRSFADESRLDETFGERYDRGALLGQGGMGEVLLSRDGRIGRDVAMKIVRARAAAAPEQQARFLREARVQGQLEHPAIVPVYDLGRDGDGAPYFTMKRVNGATLEQVLDKIAEGDAETFSRRKLLGAFGQVCLAVDYAHARGVVHRDLKPANIMLGDFGEVYLLDWGLARLGWAPAEGGAGSEATTPKEDLPQGAAPIQSPGKGQTESGSILGTPGYMAPEQVRGLSDAVDARSDVYSLGSILFEILTLQGLCEAESVSQILAETLRGVDARARARFPELDIAPELEAICVRATQLEPAQRFTGAREISDAIERYLDGDRDLALRRQLADGHAKAAREAAARAFTSDDVEARREALREVGRALALDPEHAGALRELSDLLTRPPRVVPEAAANEIHALEREGQRRAAMVGFYCYLSFFAYVPLGLWMGVRELTAYFVPGPLWLAAALLSLRVALRPHPTGKMPYSLIIVSSLAVASMTFIFGPLILLPCIAVVNTFAFMSNRDRTRRPFILGCGIFSVLLPLALESLGVLPQSYSMQSDRIIVFANSVGFPPVPTRLFLLATNLGAIVVSAVFVGKMRDLLSAKENEIHVQAWQLKQLVPEEISGTSSAPTEAAPSCPLGG